jgi:hypothetical protein
VQRAGDSGDAQVQGRWQSHCGVAFFQRDKITFKKSAARRGAGARGRARRRWMREQIRPDWIGTQPLRLRRAASEPRAAGALEDDYLRGRSAAAWHASSADD